MTSRERCWQVNKSISHESSFFFFFLASQESFWCFEDVNIFFLARGESSPLLAPPFGRGGFPPGRVGYPAAFEPWCESRPRIMVQRGGARGGGGGKGGGGGSDLELFDDWLIVYRKAIFNIWLWSVCCYSYYRFSFLLLICCFVFDVLRSIDISFIPFLLLQLLLLSLLQVLIVFLLRLLPVGIFITFVFYGCN